MSRTTSSNASLLLALALVAVLSAAPHAAQTAARVEETLASLGPGDTLLVALVAPACEESAALRAMLFAPDDRATLPGRFAPLILPRDSADGAAVGQRYHVTDHPTILVLSADGRLRGRIEGFDDPVHLRAGLDTILRGRTPSTAALRAIATANPFAAAPRLALGRRLLHDGEAGEAHAVLQHAVALDPSGWAGVAGEALLLHARHALYVTGDFDVAVERLAYGRIQLAGGPTIPALLTLYAEASLLQGDRHTAEMTLHSYTAAHPYDPLPFLLRAAFFETHDLDRDEVDRDLGVVFSLSPSDDLAARAHYLRARLRLREARFEAARAAIARALALRQESALYRELLEEVESLDGSRPND